MQKTEPNRANKRVNIFIDIGGTPAYLISSRNLQNILRYFEKEKLILVLDPIDLSREERTIIVNSSKIKFEIDMSGINICADAIAPPKTYKNNGKIDEKLENFIAEIMVRCKNLQEFMEELVRYFSFNIKMCKLEFILSSLSNKIIEISSRIKIPVRAICLICKKFVKINLGENTCCIMGLEIIKSGRYIPQEGYLRPILLLAGIMPLISDEKALELFKKRCAELEIEPRYTTINNKNTKSEENNMAKPNLETVRGMRDFLPEDEIVRQELIDKIRKVLERYGFAPWNAPVLEYESLLKGKGTVEEKLIYRFKDLGDRDVVLRPEKTPSLARIIVQNPNLPKPLKLYNIEKSWRYERPQAGRYREFTQCDIDIVGSASPLADAELLACTGAILREIGLQKFTFRINSRKLMNELLTDAGVSKNQIARTLRVLDKLDKLSSEEIKRELRAFLSEESAIELLELMKLSGDWCKISKTIKVCDDTKKTIEEFLKYLKSFGIKNFIFDLSLARGLDYYTGVVFEISAGEEIGSVAGGGRYDQLIGIYSGQDIPATGLALGFERLIDVLKAKKIKTKTKVYVVPIKETAKAIEIAEELRKNGINCDLDLSGRSIGKNLEYASKMEIPFAILVGEQEIKLGKVKLRDMQTGEEELLSVENVIAKLK